MPTAVITGASAGLGKALTTELFARGWHIVITARGEDRLDLFAGELRVTDRDGSARLTALAGDVASPDHRRRLVAEIDRRGSLDLLVNNASTLGPTPLGPLGTLSASDLSRVFAVNVIAPFALVTALLPILARSHGTVIDISSDASVEHYPHWGGYGASKAALDHLTLTFGAENLDITCYALDPGDMRTDMQQAAFPGEDISDRRSPNEVVPALVDLITTRPPSGRYRAGDRVALPDAVQKGNPVQEGSPAVAAS